MKEKRFIAISMVVIIMPMGTFINALAETNQLEKNNLFLGDNSECTTVSVGKDVSVDGSTIIPYNSDCGGCPFDATIIAAQDWEKDDMRAIMHRGEAHGEMPQIPHTFKYLRSCLPVMNEKGVAIGETTCSIDDSTEYGKEVKEVMRSSEGFVDYEYILEVVLERASTAREAVEILGGIIEPTDGHLSMLNVLILQMVTKYGSWRSMVMISGVHSNWPMMKFLYQRMQPE